VDSDFPGDSQVGDGVATCPEGKRVVGGGLGTTAQYPSADLQLSGPLDETGSTLDTETGDIARSWYADVYNHNYPHNYKAFALCSATSDATVVATTFPMASDPVRGEVAGCPPGKRILGGGVGTTSDEVYDDLQVSGPLDSAGFTASTGDGDIARFWYGNVRNGPGARTYKIFALCGTDELLPLSAGSGGNGGGKVTSSPAGIDCPATCFTTFGYGEKITLKAKATLGSWFKGWSGDCSGTGQCVVSMKKGRSVTAIFAPSPSARKPLTVELAGDGSGRVTSTPEGIDCGSSCTRLYDKGTRVTLTADPAADSSFYGWSGGGCTGSGPCKVTVNADTTVTAYFPAGPPPHPPETKITDVSVSRTNRTAKFEFKSPHPSGESGDVSFECKLTGEAPRLEDWRPCSSPRAYDDLHQGEHVFSVRVTIDGTTDSTPAKEAFTI
jgi:hypothetical protein